MNKDERRYIKWNLIKEELDRRNIKYELLLDYGNGYYMDNCLEMILIDGEECFGLFEDEDGGLLICSGECLYEINYRYNIEKIVDDVINELIEK